MSMDEPASGFEPSMAVSEKNRWRATFPIPISSINATKISQRKIKAIRSASGATVGTANGHHLDVGPSQIAMTDRLLINCYNYNA